MDGSLDDNMDKTNHTCYDELYANIAPAIQMCQRTCECAVRCYSNIPNSKSVLLLHISRVSFSLSLFSVTLHCKIIQRGPCFARIMFSYYYHLYQIKVNHHLLAKVLGCQAVLGINQLHVMKLCSLIPNKCNCNKLQLLRKKCLIKLQLLMKMPVTIKGITSENFQQKVQTMC